jgi:type IV pilus assembly protein PilV
MNAGIKRRMSRPGAAYCRGLTLVENLIALLVLSIGLLGLASLQTASLQFNTSAYQRTQATILASDMADRLRANRQAALNDLYTVSFENAPRACGGADMNGTVPQQDISAWLNTIACRLPESSGSIARNGNEFTFTVRWDDSQGRENPMQFRFTTAL